MKKYGPKEGLSPTVGTPCGICGSPLEVGDFTTLFPTTLQQRYCDDSVEVHWSCAMLATQAHREPR